MEGMDRKTIHPLLVIYHPPLGSAGNTHTRYLDQVSELLQLTLTNHKNLVLLRDINIAIQDLGNLDSQTYIDTMQALGLTQNINQPTHQVGNTLDYVYRESLDTIGVRHNFISEYISDHRLVGIEINQRKANAQLDNQPRRQYKKQDLSNFTKEFRNEKILMHSQLWEIWSALETQLKRTLDRIIP